VRSSLLALLLLALPSWSQDAAKTFSILPNGRLQFFDTNLTTPHTFALLAPTTPLAANLAWTLPTSDATNALCSDGTGHLSFTACQFFTLTRPVDASAAQINFPLTGSLVKTWVLGTTSDEDNPSLSQFALLFNGATLWRVRNDGSLFTRGLSPYVGSGAALGNTGNRWAHTWTNYLTVTDPVSGSGGVNADLRPRIDATLELGGSTFRWGKIYAKDVDFSGACTGTGCGSFSTAVPHTWTASQTFSTADLLAVGTSNVGTGAAPWTNMFSTILYGESIAVSKPTTSFGTSYKWLMQSSTDSLYLADPGNSNILLYQAPTTGTRQYDFKGHLYPLTDTQTWDVGQEWPGTEWRNMYAFGPIQGGSFRIRTGNGTSTEVISTAMDATVSDLFVKHSGTSRVSIFNGGPSAGGIIQTYDSTGATVLNKLDQTGLQVGTGGSGTTTPTLITSDATYGTGTVGQNFKVMLFNNGTTDNIGLGVSAGLFEIIGGVSDDIGFFMNGATPTQLARIKSSGIVDATSGFSVGGTTVVNSSRDITGHSLAIGGSSSIDASRNIAGLSLAINGGSAIDSSRNFYANALSINGTLTIDLFRNLTVASCVGCVAGIGQNITFSSDSAYDLGSQTLRLHNLYMANNLLIYRNTTDTNARVNILPGGPTGTGLVTVTDSSGATLSRLGPDGVRSDVGFIANGNTGLSATFTPSACSSVTFTFGILTAKAGC